MAFEDITPEQEAKIALLRIMLGDVESSVFYPILTDEEYYLVLELNNWNVKKAARQAGFSIVFYLSQVNYRERTGDIEVWNNASIEYRKALQDFLDENSLANLPLDLKPWVGGTSAKEVCKLIHDPEYLRHPLASISHCSSWWTRVKNYDCLIEDRRWGCGCG
ncbi:MAG: hypothetical protein M0R77_08020 [Gammaproteobacteria bacterium]|nr:hypothetical protein [Gammaproteobacteria bacterium]